MNMLSTGLLENVNHIYCAGDGYIPLEFATGFTSAHNGWLLW